MTFTPEAETLLKQAAAAGWKMAYSDNQWVAARVVLSTDPSCMDGQRIISASGASPLGSLVAAEGKLLDSDTLPGGGPIVKIVTGFTFHMAGLGVTVGKRSIQRCAICGKKLLDSAEDDLVERRDANGLTVHEAFTPGVWMIEKDGEYETTTPTTFPPINCCIELVEAGE